MRERTWNVTRRDVLRIAVFTSGGLLVLGSGLMLLRRNADPVLHPNVFLTVDAHGTVTITIPRPDMGQGVRTALAVLVADELGASLPQVHLLQAEYDSAYGDQYVGGSNSVRGSWLPLRMAGAAAREMLTRAAAAQWSV